MTQATYEIDLFQTAFIIQENFPNDRDVITQSVCLDLINETIRKSSHHYSIKSPGRSSIHISCSISTELALRIIFRNPASREKYVKGKKEQHKPIPLGEGTFKKVYEGTSLLFKKGEGEITCTISPIAVAKMKTRFYTELITTTLQRIGSPYLLAIPDKTFPHGTKPYIFLSMPLLKNKDLFSFIEDDGYDKVTCWGYFLEGFINGAKGCLALHQNHLVHRDPTTQNLTRDGLFDFDSVCPEGVDVPVNGANPDFLPPEVLIPYLGHAEKYRPDIAPRILAAIGSFSVPAADITAWKTAYPCSYPDPENPEELRIKYTPAVDVFILGRQCEEHFGYEHYLWPTTEHIKAFILRMLDLEPTKRPSMQEVVDFFEPP